MFRPITYALALLTICTCQHTLAQTTDEGKFYPNPGIVAFRDGQWMGSDHLYNISNKIDVVIEVLKPEKLEMPISNTELKERVVKIFKDADIIPYAESMPGKPLHPFFHLLVMVSPIEKGYVAYIHGRLFENISVDRVKLHGKAFMQAITWESSNLILSPESAFKDQLIKSVDEIASTFTDRFTFYESIRTSTHKN